MKSVLILPETERLVERVIALPAGTSIGPEDSDRTCQIIRFATTHGPEISTRLPGDRT